MQTTAAPCLHVNQFQHVKQLPAEADDRDLAARVTRGDPAALDDLVEQMAEVLGAKRNAVEARLSRARKQLEPLLTSEVQPND